MTGFGSINDLLPKKKQSGGSAPALQASFGDVEKAFEKKMGEVGVKEREQEAMQFAQTIGYPYINLEKFPVSQLALKQMPREQAETVRAVCFFASQDDIRIGAIDPSEESVQELLYQLGERTHAHAEAYVISEHSLARVLSLYDTLPTIAVVTKDITIQEEDIANVQASVTDFSTFQEAVHTSSTSDLVTVILGAAMKLDASDVHVEAEETGIIVRFRLDGILHDAATLSKEVYAKLVSRIKLVASLKMNITDKPQDGRFTIKRATGDVDVRVSAIPTVYGESIVMRLLHQDREGINIEELGIRGHAYEQLKKEMERPNGMIITTGPTGSGKTTTLYAMLNILNQPGVKIITLEDPVEYKLEGVNQSQIDASKGYTFASGLRSMLRQDPDIAMVGEIRDLETADTAIQAALTGHLILSTIHTNSAAGAIPRFLAMGVKAFLLAPALNSVIGQRLVRRICDACKGKAALTDEQQTRVTDILASLPKAVVDELAKKSPVFYEGKGCNACNGIGYKGRIGIYEIFVVDEEIERLIREGSISEYDIEKAAVAAGMITMVQDGILKTLDGLTSVSEVFRVIE